MDTKTFTNKVYTKNHTSHKDKNGSWLYNYDKVEYKKTSQSGGTEKYLQS